MSKEKNKVTEVAVADLIPDDMNFNKGTEYGNALLEKSFQKFGAGRSILLDKNNRIIAGNKAAGKYGELGGEKVIVVETDGDTLVAVKRTDVDLDSQAGRELALADNATQRADLEWDTQVVKEVSEQWGIDAKEWGVEMPDELSAVGGQEDDFDADAEVETRCKKGDIWQLGEHRLMCGDSTSTSDVNRLVEGNLMDMLLTDPPYNVDYEGKTKENLKIKNDKLNDGEFREFLNKAIAAAVNVMKPGGAFYIWHADSEGYNFRGACIDNGLRVRETLIWNKNSMVMGRQDYQWKHEPCLYGWKEGGSHYFVNERNHTTVLDFNRPNRNGEHPTMKPVELFASLIKNSSRTQESVLDLFGGSGTTIIASEQLGRRAYLMELDPHYCDVIIARWEKFTGNKAFKI